MVVDIYREGNTAPSSVTLTSIPYTTLPVSTPSISIYMYDWYNRSIWRVYQGRV